MIDRTIKTYHTYKRRARAKLSEHESTAANMNESVAITPSRTGEKEANA